MYRFYLTFNKILSRSLTMTLVAHEADIFKINLAKFKRSFKFCEMSSEEMWKVNRVKGITILHLLRNMFEIPYVDC